MNIGALSSEARKELYAGQVIFAPSAALSDIVQHANHMISNAFFGLDPRRAHSELPFADYRERVTALRRAFNTDTAIRHLIARLVTEWGADPADAYFDTLKLRISPPVDAWGGQDPGHPLAPLAAHRDTWGSNVMQQINVWAPLVPLALGRTLAMWPELFAKPVENDSAVWDLDELRRRRSSGGDYLLMPTAVRPPPLGSAERLMPEVGEAAFFSGAHLHASVPNRTGLARLNFELRVVFLADRNARLGAPNVDGRAPRTPLHWFKSLDGKRSLADAPTPLALI